MPRKEGHKSKGEEMKAQRVKYDKNLPRKMYTYFAGYTGSEAPSFTKFARSMGMTLSELNGMREHKRFDEAYRECSEIRRDYLIDTALTKRHDPSFVKFLLTYEFGMGDTSSTDNEINVKIEVI